MSKVLVVGFGIEGKALAGYFLNKGEKVTIADQKLLGEFPQDEVEVFTSQGVEWINGENYLERLGDFDLVAFSPGVKYPTYKKIIESGVPTTTQMKIFFEETPTKNIIGVTGTKGKGTTSTLIYEILKAAGKRVRLAGNIGEGALPLLKELHDDDDWVVLELSSYQLRDLEKSPHIGVILNITPDHLDVHPDFDDYVSAKANIIRFQNQEDYALLNGEYEVTRSLGSLTKGQVKIFTKQDFRETGFKLQIPGEHNFENASAALAVADILTIDRSIVKSVFANFQGLPHRLEEVAEIKGVRYINDSFATSPAPTIVGIKAFSEPKIVILGGFGKIKDFSDLAKEIASNKSVKHILAIGNSGGEIVRELEKSGYHNITNDLGSIDEVVKAASEKAKEGDVVLFSPADSSFDWFKNYADRGERFKEAVEELK